MFLSQTQARCLWLPLLLGIFSSIATAPSPTQATTSQAMSSIVEVPQVLGGMPQTPYGVVIPLPHLPATPLEMRQRLQPIREVVPNAFFTRHRAGYCIYVQGFKTAAEAYTFATELERQGWSTRVVYFR